MKNWKDTDELKELFTVGRRFEPEMSDDAREYLYAGWKNAVEATRIFKHKINENL